MSRALIVLALFLGSCAEDASAPPPESPVPTPEATFAPTEGSASPEPAGGVECVDATTSGKQEVPIRMIDDQFRPACLTVLGGQGLKLANRGSVVHNFSVEGSDVDIDLQPGEVNRTEAIAGAVPAGEHTFFCTYHRSRGMEGRITISEAG